jgi:hypothetical protein
MGSEPLYRTVFYAAAAYNVVWGAVVTLFPGLFFRVFGLPPINYPFLMSGIGMFVAVYGYGYWAVAREPRRYPQLVVVGLLGKTLGPVGWAWNVWLGTIPARTLWTNVFNDLVWIPFFVSYLLWQRREAAAGTGERPGIAESPSTVGASAG